MAIEPPVSAGSDAAILARLIRPDDGNLPASAAKALLAIRFDSPDLDRIHELVTKNQDAALMPAEKADLESYLRVSSFLDLMHAKARRSLRKPT
jgi:hypothetical protein